MLSGLKFASASDNAKLLHVLALLYAADNLTDGFITEAAARKLTKARAREFERSIEHLTTVQLGCSTPSWEPRDSDQREPNSDQTLHERVWFLHDYDDPLYKNPLKADLDVRRVQKAAAGHEGGKKSAEARAKKYGTARPLSSTAEADREAGAAKHPEATGSGVASTPDPSKLNTPHEADAKLARAQPFPSLPLHTNTHGDEIEVGSNGNAPAQPSPQVQVVRLLDWLLMKRGWSSWSSPDSQQHEAQLAVHIVELSIPRDQLYAKLDAWWQESDPDDRPSSLGYFWTRLQDEQHQHLKQQGRSHVRMDAMTKLEPSAKRGKA